MALFRKISLYFHTLRHLKMTQFEHRLAFKLGHPKPDFSPAPPVVGVAAAVPFPPMPRCYMGENRFRFLNDEQPFTGWNDPERNKLWLYNLHYFDGLRQEGITQEEGDRWIAKWIAENPAPHGNGWEPYPLSLRIVNWIKWHLSGHPLSPEAVDSLAVQVRYLTKRLEYHLLANHLIANAKALVFAGCFFSGTEGKKWLAKGLEIYREQLPEQLLADGGHFERSPMYHSIILEDLLDLNNLGVPLNLRERIDKMLDYLAVMTGPDGEIARFNDAANKIALSPEQLFNYAEQLGFPRPQPVIGSRDLPDSGYARLTFGKWTAICDGGAVGPEYQPGHAHADTLSFELWYDTLRLVVDSGTGAYIDSPCRREQRGTAGHNTLMLDGGNSSEVWGAHRVARRAKIVRHHFSGDELTAAHNGYAPVIHERRWKLRGNEVEITDSIAGKGKHQLELFWHFPPESKLSLTGKCAAVEVFGQKFLILCHPEGEMTIEKGHYSPEFGIWLSIPVLRCRYQMSLPQTITTFIRMEMVK